VTSKTGADFGILLLGFNRPLLLQKTVSCLKAGSDLSRANVFLSLDGPRNSGDIEMVRMCEKILDQLAGELPNACKLYSSRNQGLRNKVISSVSTALGEVDSLFVMEDDCLISDTGIDFFNWGLQQLDSRKDVGAISGTYWGSGRHDQAFLAKRFSSWGWATNKAIWQGFLDSKYSQLPLIELVTDIANLTKDDPLPYKYEYRQISKNVTGLDSWAVPFDLFLRSENLYTLKPTTNQIQNIGFGEAATHTVRGASLSKGTVSLDGSNLTAASLTESIKIERAEAWSKFANLAREALSRKS